MKSDTAPKNSTGLRWAVATSGAVTFLIGVLVIIGWHAHLLTLVQLNPTMAPMQYNTALCFILAGGALNAWAWRRGRLAEPILGGALIVAGGLTLSEYLFQYDLGIDQLFFHTYIFERVSHPGRMAPVSALCFVLVGLALIEGGARKGRWRFPIMGSLASVVISICAVAVLGYIFDLPGTYGWGQLTRIALHTAIGLTILGSGVFAMAWQVGRGPGERTPRWLPVPMGLGVFTATLVLYFALDRKQDEEIGRTVRASFESVKSQILLRMDGRMHGLTRMAENWGFSGRPAQAAWEADATHYVHDLPELQGLEWIDASHHIRWVAPVEGNSVKLNLDLLQEPRRHAAAERARQEHKPVLSQAVPLFRGGLGFIIYVPVNNVNRPSEILMFSQSAPHVLDRRGHRARMDYSNFPSASSSLTRSGTSKPNSMKALAAHSGQ